MKLRNLHESKEWIGVDLDGTLAKYTTWEGPSHIGEPIPDMIKRVKRWLKQGKTVKIFTARATKGEQAKKHIRNWCKEQFGKILPITNIKDQHMIQLWDDRCKQVKKNTGMVVE